MGVERTPNGWRVRWTDPYGQRVCKGGFTAKGHADAFYKNVLAEMARGEYVNPKLGRRKLQGQHALTPVNCQG